MKKNLVKEMFKGFSFQEKLKIHKNFFQRKKR